MKKFHQGIAPLIIVLLIALGLAGGATAGYVFREQIKKAVSGATTAEEIQQAIDNFKLGQNKFELEGILLSIDAVNKNLTIKIQGATKSIKSFGLAEVKLSYDDSLAVTQNGKTVLLTDVPLESQVHVKGVIVNEVLTASSLTVQREEANTNKDNHFVVGGVVKVVYENELELEVKTANKKAQNEKGIRLAVKVDSNTIIEKARTTIVLADIQVDDEVQIIGFLTDDSYLASKIEVKVKERLGELELEQNGNANQNQGETNKNQEQETETEENANSGNSSSNSNNSNRGGNANIEVEEE